MSEAVVAHRLAVLQGRGLPEAAFVFLRYFTNLTSIGIASLMTWTVWRGLQSRPLPAAQAYAAALVYIAVVTLTYEALLRRLWSPTGIWLVRDALMHDVVPGLTLLFWLICAPKAGLRLSDPARWLAYPLSYAGIVFVAGAAGSGYPYPFVDVSRLGYGRVFLVASAFLALFYGLGMAIVLLGRILAGRSPELERRARITRKADPLP